MADEEKKTSKSESKTDKKSDKKKSSKKNPFKGIGSFFKSVRSETKKVIWPDAKSTLKNTAIVLIVVFVVGICIYGVDTVLSLGMKEVKGLADTTTTTTSTTVASTEASE